MSVNLDQIDELVKRTHVSYEVAKEALENCSGDMVEAIIYLERKGKTKSNQGESLFDKICGIVKKGNETKIVISKKEDIVLSIPVTLVVIITIIAPYVTVIAVILALITGHKIRLVGKGDYEKVNHTMDKISQVVTDAKSKIID